MHHLTIKGLGAHEHTEVTLHEGVTCVSGASETGKSTLMLAASFALWGTDPMGKALPVETIRDGAERASVTLGLSGLVVERSLAVSKSGSRRISRSVRDEDGRRHECPTEADVLRRLPAAYQDAEAARLVMFPFVWRELLAGKGKGLALREALDRMLPGKSAADLIDERLPDAAPRTEKAAEAHRRDVNRRHNQLIGAEEAARDALREARDNAPGEVDPADVDAANEVLEEHAAWQAEQAAKDEAYSNWSTVKARRESWEQAKAVAGAEPDEPEPTAEELRRLCEAADLASDKAHAAKMADDRARVSLGNAEQSLRYVCDDIQRLEETVTSEALPLPCAGVDAGLCRIASRAAEARAGTVVRLETRRAQRAVCEEAVSTAGAAKVAAGEAAAAAAVDAEEALAAYRRADTLALTWRTYRDRVAALGEEPEEAGEEPEQPAAPSVERQERVTKARAVLQAAGEAHAVSEAHHARLERLASTHKQAQADLMASADEAQDAGWWVEIIRAAPGEALAAKLGHLGDDPVSFDTTDGFEVLIDGRPWWLASRGRQVVADAELRAALRDAAGLDELPIFIDDVSSVRGQPVPEPDGAVLLVTTEGDLTVTGEVHRG